MTQRFRLFANLATLANASVGLGAVLYVLAGNKLWAMFLIVGGIAFDGMDGLFSRRATGPPSKFGRFADSIADALTFGIAPASLLAVHTDRPVLWAPFGVWCTVVAGVFASCAIGRLVYFTARGYQRSDFLGAPTPQGALGIIALVLLSDVPGFWGTNPPLVIAGAAIVAMTMIVPVPFPKIRRGSPMRGISAVTAVGLVVSLISLQFRPSAGSIPFEAAFLGVLVAVSGIVVYYLLGPLTVARPDLVQAG